MTKKDYTLAVNELRRHYNELSAHKKSVRAMVKAEFEAKIDFEIARRIEAEELKFANHLAAVKEREGLPVSIIQDHVLRTRTWSRWEKWRDMAGLEPEFVVAENGRADREKAKEEARGYIWADDYSTLTVTKAADKTLETPVVYPIPADLKPYNAQGAYWPRANDDNAELVAARLDSQYHKNLSAEITRQVDAGNVPDNR